MKVIKTKTGRIQLLATLGGMEVGECWKLRPDALSLNYLKVTVCNYSKAVNKMFTVSYPSGAAKITVTRTK